MDGTSEREGHLGDAPTIHADERASLGALATVAAPTGAGAGDLSGAPTIAGGGPPRGREPGGERLTRGSSVARYVVLDRLGAGGMGVVYAAYDPELDRKVALKLLHLGRDGAGALAGRLKQEAQAMARLSHPNVVTVHDVGVHDGQIFLAMEMIEGTTLREWLAAAPRSWAEIVAIFVQAGRGLAAAHAAGLVHRDFKPDNVLCTPGGRACVGDFGLARASRGGERPPEGVAAAPVDLSSKTASLTRTGAVMGTPAYMAPEQHLGQPVGPAADVFAFCVALYEALHGLHPFGGDTFFELQLRVLEGAIREPPRPSRAPARLTRAIAQGLARAAEARPPTMDALLAAIEAAARPRRRWLALEVAAAAALTAAAAWGLSDRTGDSATADPAARCRSVEQAIDGTWGAAREAELRRAFADSGLIYAGDVADRVVARLDAYRGRWARARRDVCLAHHVGGDISARQLERASACLERKRRRLDRLIALLGEADEDAVKEAIAVVDDLDPPERCRDDAVLAGDDPAARDPAIADRLERADAAIEDARAWTRARRYDAAAAAMASLVAELEPLGDTSERARAMIQWSDALYARDREAAQARAREAVALCWRARDDRCVADAVIEALSAVAGAEDDLGLVEHLFELGVATIARLGGDLRVEAHLRFHYGSALRNRGDYERALQASREALALFRRVGDRLWIARATKNIGIVHERRGEYDAAAEHLRESLSVLIEEYGGDHPEVVNTLGILGVLAYRYGDYATALEIMDRQSELERRIHGERSRQVADVLSNRAIVALYRGDLEGAEASMRASLAVGEAHGGLGHVWVAQARGNLGEIRRRVGDLTGAAVEIAAALELLTRAHAQDHPDFITAHTIAGHIELQRGDLRAAADHYARAHAVIAAHGLTASPAYVDLWIGRAELELRRGRAGAARSILAEVQPILDAGLHHPWDRATFRFLEARLLAAEGDGAGARARAREAIALFDAVLPGAQRERDEAAAWLARR